MSHVRTVRVEHPRCPYCHDALRPGTPPEVCVACHALHHATCWAELGACAACGAPTGADGSGARPAVRSEPSGPPAEPQRGKAPAWTVAAVCFGGLGIVAAQAGAPVPFTFLFGVLAVGYAIAAAVDAP